MKPFLLVLSSPSGGGKTTIARALVSAREDVGYSVSATTRNAREGETEGVDYHFFDRDEFISRRAAGEFLEWAEYGGSLYGTLTREVEAVLTSGRHVVLDIEVQGARLVRERWDDVVSIFILPPSAGELVRRLEGRGAMQNLKERMLTAIEELEEASAYDYIVVNDDRMQAVSEVAAIVDSESCRSHRVSSLQEDVANLRRELTEIVSCLEH
ncbi:MAG: guanylate kinase [Gemmatimonadales bacterium]